MEERAFELWALSRCIPLGWEASRTPRSYDGGADGILVHRATGAKTILQCKHKQRRDKVCDATAVDDLLRARECYSGKATRLIVLSNAERYSQAAQRTHSTIWDRLDREERSSQLAAADDIVMSRGQTTRIRGMDSNMTMTRQVRRAVTVATTFLLLFCGVSHATEVTVHSIIGNPKSFESPGDHLAGHLRRG